MTEFSECNSISLKIYVWFPDFLAEHQWKSANWIPMGNEHDFSTTILNKYSIKMPQVSVVLFSTSQNLSLSILILQLNMMADRDWRNWHHPHDCSFPSSNLSCLRAFLNKKACVLWKWALCPTHIVCVIVINTQSCLTDIVMAGCAERVHWLICLEMTCST